MKKNNFLTICVIVLLLLNACTLFIVFRTHRQEEHEPTGKTSPGDYIVEQLKLDTEQQRKFGIMRQKHHELAIRIQHEEERLHDFYFGLLKTDNPDMSKMDSIAVLIGEQKRAQATAAFEHFRELRSLCREDQKKLFDITIDEIARRVTGPPPGKGGPPPPRE